MEVETLAAEMAVDAVVTMLIAVEVAVDDTIVVVLMGATVEIAAGKEAAAQELEPLIRAIPTVS